MAATPTLVDAAVGIVEKGFVRDGLVPWAIVPKHHGGAVRELA